MRARYYWILPLAAASAVAIFEIRIHDNVARQSAALRSERLRHVKLLALRAENLRLESAQLSDAERRRLESQHAEVDSLRARLNDLKRVNDESAGSPVQLAKDWTYAGRATPRSTIESVLWAASRSDTDRLTNLVGFPPELRAQADAMFAHLPETSQQEYGSPEKVVATLLAGSFPRDAQASQVFVDRQYGEEDASITMALTHSDGQSRTNLFRFHNTPDGWQLLIPASVMKDYEKTLLGEPQPSDTGAP
jgi:hypothetical protein